MSAELILGVIGTILGIVGTGTGIYSLYLARKRMEKEKPDLHIEILDCRHKIATNNKTTNLYIKYTLHNKGDRGTQLSKMRVSATGVNGKLHHASKDLSKEEYLNAHDSITVSHYLHFEPFQYNTSMKCKFQLYHTHGVFPFEYESTESSTAIEETWAVFI